MSKRKYWTIENMILFDLSYIRLNPYAGVSKYAYRILDYIVKNNNTNNYVLLLNYVSKDFILNKYPQFQYMVIGGKFQSKIPLVRTLLLAMQYKKKVNESGCKVSFCPWGNEISCLKTNVFTISVIHDLQNIIDLKGFKQKIYKKIADLVIQNSEKIVTISDFSKKQIIDFYPDKKNDIVNLGNSVDMAEAVMYNINIREKYILYVGRLCKMKNVITLIKAYNIIKDRIQDRKLVLVGSKNKYWRQVLFPYIQQNNLESKILVIQNCTEQELAFLYRDADLFVFPSLREGFGSPPIEAAYMKTPVISSKCDSLDEVCCGLLYTYDNPIDEKELSNLMLSVLSNPPSETVLETIKETMIKKYSIDVIGKKIVEFIESYN